MPNASDTAAAPLPLEHLRTVQRVSRLIDTMMGAPDNAEIRQHKAEICRLPVRATARQNSVCRISGWPR